MKLITKMEVVELNQAGVEQRTGTAMLKSFFNRKPDVVDTMICRVCKKDVKAAKGQLNSI